MKGEDGNLIPARPASNGGSRSLKVLLLLVPLFPSVDKYMSIKELAEICNNAVTHGYGESEVVLSVDMGLSPASLDFTSFEDDNDCLVIRDNALSHVK